MPLPKRIIKVKMKFPATGTDKAFDRDLDGSLNIKIRTSKNILHIQNTCEIEVTGMSAIQRGQMLSAFTAWNYRKDPTRRYVGVEIFAGYENKDNPSGDGSRIFIGDVVKCSLTGENPNMVLQITAYTRQVDRSDLIPAALPKNPTFKQAVESVARAAGLIPDCRTSRDSQSIPNFGTFQLNPLQGPQYYTVQAAIAMLWRVDPDGIAIWVDDDHLYARNVGDVIQKGDVLKLNSFVGTPPSWTEWGVTGTILFNSSIKVASGIELVSRMNPSVNGQYVVTSLEYELASRDTPFYITFKASPGRK